MYIIKRNGTQVEFNNEKIRKAIEAANNEVSKADQLSAETIKEIVADVEKTITRLERAVSVEEVQDMVEKQIVAQNAYELAKAYITYRYKRA